ncbi:hypothetical protein ABIC08_009334 [Bradyrhizobium sp. RT9b]
MRAPSQGALLCLFLGGAKPHKGLNVPGLAVGPRYEIDF